MVKALDPNRITHVVAIDGPAGAGKSTAARLSADRLGFSYLDTGAMYRAATWRAMINQVNLDDPVALMKSTQDMALELVEVPGGIRVIVDGHDATREIRSGDVTNNIYKLDRCPGVRDIMVGLQRAWATRGPTVAEGRDIGTVVFPNARCKLYLDASLDERVRRRAEELRQNRAAVEVERLTQEMQNRDKRDMTREIAPLRRADDAIPIDTTAKTVEQVVDEIVRIARERLG